MCYNNFDQRYEHMLDIHPLHQRKVMHCGQQTLESLPLSWVHYVSRCLVAPPLFGALLTRKWAVIHNALRINTGMSIGVHCVVGRRTSLRPKTHPMHGNRNFQTQNGPLITSLAKEVMFLVALVSLSVCLFVCLSVDNITQKVMNGLGWNFMDGSWVVQGRRTD